MAAVGLQTYEDTSRREDLVDIVTNISPQETPLLSGLGEGPTGMQTLHEYLTAALASAADNANVEGKAFTVKDLSQPSRSNNIMQIFRADLMVTGTELSVNTGAEISPMEYQIEKNLKEHARDIELALMAGSKNSGDSNSARRLAGVINSITTNFTSYPSGTSFTETQFNDVLGGIWTQTDMVADEIYAGAFLKRRVSELTAGNTRFVAADDRRLVKPVDVYESDFGPHKVFLHRNIPDAATTRYLVALRNEFWKLSYLQNRRTKVVDLLPDGDRERKMVVTELTLENRGEASNALVQWRNVS